MANPSRYDRYHQIHEKPDFRTEGEHDRDRVLYSTALRRLAGVTQVVSPLKAPISHNRLTHTLKAAQISNRIALKFMRDDQQKPLAEELGVDADVVEAATLAHDLGHPPFGHVGEIVLHEIMVAGDNLDGFEGNAQSFRIVTQLAIRRTIAPEPDVFAPGLNLTRATLSAMLKYPWIRSSKKGHDTKWGAYSTEEEELKWAREMFAANDEQKSAEAEILDWADDIAYSVHDVEDFYKADLIPLDRLANRNPERERFLAFVADRLKKKPQKTRNGKKITEDDITTIGNSLVTSLLNVNEPYSGTREQRGALKFLISKLIDRYIREINLHSPTKENPHRVSIDDQIEIEVYILKQLTWKYVIENPALEREQHGRAYVLNELFAVLFEESRHNPAILPVACHELLDELEDPQDDQGRKRIIADTICTLTDDEAMRMYAVLKGLDQGRIFDSLSY